MTPERAELIRQLAARQRASRRRIKPRKLGRPRYPWNVERAFAAGLSAQVQVLPQLMERQGFGAKLRGWERAVNAGEERRAVAQDADTASWVQEVEDYFENLRSAYSSAIPEVFRREFLARQAQAIAHFGEKELRAQLQRSLSVDVFLTEPYLADEMLAFVTENSRLIKGMVDKTIDDIQAEAMTALRNGVRAETLEGTLMEQFGLSERRAALIARDQTGKFNGALTKVRQKRLGITRYRWRGMMDNRERQSHIDLEDEEFTWDAPPLVDGERAHPGEPINCRCTAEPVLDDIADEAEQAVENAPF